MLSITRYIIRNKRLSFWVRFNIRISCSGTIHAPSIHLNGLRREHSVIHHTGKIKVFGISFHACGLSPIIQGQVKKNNDRIVDLYSIAYDNRFVDQSHFIKESEAFTGASPRAFQNKNKSVKKNVIYTII